MTSSSPAALILTEPRPTGRPHVVITVAAATTVVLTSLWTYQLPMTLPEYNGVLAAVMTFTTVAGAVAAYLLALRYWIARGAPPGSSTHASRWRWAWMASAFALSVLGMGLQLVGFPALSIVGGPLHTPGDAAEALGVLHHTIFSAFLLAAMAATWLAPRQTGRRSDLAHGAVHAIAATLAAGGLVLVAAGPWRVPDLLNGMLGYTTRMQVLVVASAALSLAALVAWMRMVGRRPTWTELWISASILFGTLDLAVLAVAGGRYTRWWWVSLMMRLGQFLTPCAGLLVGLVRQERRLDTYARRLRRTLTDVVAAEEDPIAALSLLDGVLAEAPLGVALWDSDLCFLRVNSVVSAIDGVEIGAHLGRRIDEIFPPELAAQFVPPLLQVRDTGAPVVDVEIEIATEAGPRMLHARYFPIRPGWVGGRAVEGPLIGVAATIEDVTERVRAERARRRLVNQHAAVVSLGAHALSGLDGDTLEWQVVAAVKEVTAVDYCALFRPDAQGLKLVAGEGWGPTTIGRVHVPADARSHAGRVFDGRRPVVFTGRDGDVTTTDDLLARHGVTAGAGIAVQGLDEVFGVLAVYTRKARVFAPDEMTFLQSVANVVADAIERQRAEESMRQIALHDSLTGLPNRALLLDRLRQALARAQRTGSDVAVFFMDLDDFKAVNDLHGHEAGDELLVAFAGRVLGLVRPHDTVARLAGDEFVVVCEDAGHGGAERVAARITAALDESFGLSAATVRISASIGVAFASEAEGPEELLANADVAMYDAKRRGGVRHAVFDTPLRERAGQRLRLRRDLDGAVGRGELSVVYQPIYDLKQAALPAATGTVTREIDVTDEATRAGDVPWGSPVGFEALLRWAHPVLGNVSPVDFVPVAESSGLIIEIGGWVLREAAGLARTWGEAKEARGLPRSRVWVNCSGRQIVDGRIVEQVVGALESTGCDPSLLGVEITETTLLDTFDDRQQAVATLNRLRDLGVRLAMDDFGTGYSSLSYLKQLPVDVVKVDRSFVDAVDRHAGDTAIVAAVVRMAEALDLAVTAEGVETSQQLGTVRQLGCESAQGFYFSRPLPPAGVDAVLFESGVVAGH